MPRTNVEIIRRVYEAAARRDTEAVLALYDPDVEWDSSRMGIGRLAQGVYHGHHGLRSYFRDWSEAWESYEDYLEEVVDAGEYVISVVTVRTRGRASGVELQSKRAAVWTIREGKIVRVVWFPTREEALEYAGRAA
jgi:ketosteroid isomerase-like protein